jgi:hypothetical protein
MEAVGYIDRLMAGNLRAGYLPFAVSGFKTIYPAVYSRYFSISISVIQLSEYPSYWLV